MNIDPRVSESSHELILQLRMLQNSMHMQSLRRRTGSYNTFNMRMFLATHNYLVNHSFSASAVTPHARVKAGGGWGRGVGAGGQRKLRKGVAIVVLWPFTEPTAVTGGFPQKILEF